MQSKKLKCSLSACASLFLCASVSAQEAAPSIYALSGTSISGSAETSGPILTAPVPAGAAAYKTESGVYLYPTAFVGMGTNDNVTRTNTNSISSSFVNVAPQLVAELKHKGDRYTATAAVDSTTYSSSSPDNTTSSTFELAGDNYFTARSRAGWAVGLLSGADARGSNNRAVSTEPDRWSITSLNGRYIYGAAQAKGRAELDLGYRTKTYDNNRVNTVVADVDVTSVAGRVFFRLGSNSLALVEVRNDVANYPSPLALDSNTERRYYLGYTWEATAATTGIVKVGYATKDFDKGQQGYSGGSWDATMQWKPRSYSTFALQLARVPVDSSGIGTYDLQTTTGLAWNHNWTQSVSSAATYTKTDLAFGGLTRTDAIDTFSLAADYAVLRWLKVGVDLARTNLTSSAAGAEYARNVIMFTLNASL